MQDNTKRGERTLFWMKSIFLFFIVLTIWLFSQNLFEFGIQEQTLTVSLLLRVFLVVGISLALLVSFFMFLVSFFSWFYRAISNLRIMTVTDFSPTGAVILTCIPVAGGILHFFIFNDMVDRQQACMKEHGILNERFPKKLLIAWLLVTILCMALSLRLLGSSSGAMDLIKDLAYIVSFGLYIKCFSFYIRQEHRLFRVHSDELFRKHVDEVIREREIERIAGQLRKSENKVTSQTES